MTKQTKEANKPTPTRTKAHQQPAKVAAGPKTKLARLEGMLRCPDGATIAQISKALHWQAHSVRGAISGSLKKKQGLKITASKEADADRVYQIA